MSATDTGFHRIRGVPTELLQLIVKTLLGTEALTSSARTEAYRVPRKNFNETYHGREKSLAASELQTL